MHCLAARTAVATSLHGVPLLGRCRSSNRATSIMPSISITPTVVLLTRRLTATPLAFLYCPSDPGGHIDDASMGNTGDATTSYGTCDGDWYVWSVNWTTPPYSVGPQNRSLFGPNYARKIAAITDGTSNTLAASEGYIGHAQMRSCSKTAGDALPIRSPAPIRSRTFRHLVPIRRRH